MSLVVVALLCAVLVGWLAGGSLERLGAVPVRRRRLLLLALLAQAGGVVVGGPVHAVGLVVSAACAAAFLAVNRGLRGTGLVALGLAANALVVGVNGAMPVSAAAAARAGIDTGALTSGADPRHDLVSDATRLRLLGDVVPVPLPVRPEVVSPGDVLVAAGLAQLVVAGMLRPLRGVPVLPAAVPPSRPSPTSPSSAPGGRRRRRPADPERSPGRAG